MSLDIKENTEVKDKILAAATSLFWRYGTRSVTMDEIAKEIAVSKKTIYQYFKDKNEIVCRVMECKHDKQMKEMRELESNADNAIEALLKVSDFMAETFAKVNPSLLLDTKKYHPEAWELHQTRRDQIIESIKGNLRWGIQDGLYRDELPLEYLAVLRIEQVELAFDAQKFSSDQYELVKVQLAFLDHFIRGLVTLKGFQLLETYKNRKHHD
ncbi:hypothetical protein BKI52_27310 [marine bacterium AO1-C]|nr:hypothetical protein BKI52_27310 [marine bacterium AO1-C]